MSSKGVAQPRTPARKSSLAAYLQRRVKAALIDGRTFTGELRAFDRHMSLVLSDAILESPAVGNNPPQRVPCGLVIVRGINVREVRPELPWQPRADAGDRLLADRAATEAATAPSAPQGLAGPMAPAEVSVPAPAAPPPGLPEPLPAQPAVVPPVVAVEAPATAPPPPPVSGTAAVETVVNEAGANESAPPAGATATLPAKRAISRSAYSLMGGVMVRSCSTAAPFV